MPSGTGKTVSLLSLIVSYMQVYQTRTLRRVILTSLVLPDETEIDLLFTYRARDRESTGGAQEVDGIPCGDGSKG